MFIKQICKPSEFKLKTPQCQAKSLDNSNPRKTIEKKTLKKQQLTSPRCSTHKISCTED